MTATIGFFEIVVDVVVAISPILIFFLVFQFLYLKYPLNQMVKLGWGVALTALGMVLFLQGVFMGFLPIGQQIGERFGDFEHKWVIIPIGFVLGFITTLAEPAVRVLCYQVERSSSGYVRYRVLMYVLALAVGSLVAVGMVKIVYDIDFIFIIIPGYILGLGLLYISDRDYIPIAFDAGGVVTGPMAVSFLMPMALGVASVQEGGDPLVNGFGLIALIALAPILFILSLGAIIRWKGRQTN